ncbi:hypothetical protein C2I06_09545 [Niallia circulans]|uniref:hypothetical protein n=1 Tax=Niallia circulans TaxID=1397 RepID=UPI000F44AB5F|nr:hypothetical protein [Niallia circulans]AYV67099.1 hypothetical protein C2I06_09545 [Niallia circulans]
MNVPENVITDTTSMMNSMVFHIIAALLFSFIPVFLTAIILLIFKLMGITFKKWMVNIFLYLALALSMYIFIKFGLPIMQISFSDSLF